MGDAVSLLAKTTSRGRPWALCAGPDDSSRLTHYYGNGANHLSWEAESTFAAFVASLPSFHCHVAVRFIYLFLNLICKARDCHTASLIETGALLLQNTSTFALTQPRRRQNHLPATLQCFPCCVTPNLLRIWDPFWSRTGPWFALIWCGRGVHYRTWSIDSNRAAWKPHYAACWFCASEKQHANSFSGDLSWKDTAFLNVCSHTFLPKLLLGILSFNTFLIKKKGLPNKYRVSHQESLFSTTAEASGGVLRWLYVSEDLC